MSKQRPWTDEEYGFVQSSDLPHHLVAEALDRTPSAVQVARSKLRRGWKPKEPSYWTPEEDAYLLTKHVSAKQAAEKLGRTLSSINNRRQVLGARGLGNGRFGGNTSPHKIGSRPLLAKTCPDCGLILQAKWFMQDGQRKAWSKQCRRCHDGAPERKGKRKRGPGGLGTAQSVSLPGAINHNKPWLESDVKILADPDMTRLDKALALGRTYYSVMNACRQFDLPSKTGLGDPERDQWIIDNPNLDRVAEILAELNKTEPTTPTRPDFEWDD